MRLDFHDGSSEQLFWGRFTGYCVEIDGVDYELTGEAGFKSEFPDTTFVSAKTWDDELGRGVGDVGEVPVGPSTTVSVY